MAFIFQDRHEAGMRLAERLKGYANRPDVIVLGLPRGGIVVAYEISRALSAPLHAFVVRKLGVPGHEELAMGALASGDVTFINHSIIRSLNIDGADLTAEIAKERRELLRREQLYGEDKFHLHVDCDQVIIVDDGLATGASMMAAIQAVKGLHPVRVIVAVPVAPEETLHKLKSLADEVVCLASPEPFYSVGQWYATFEQVEDEEVCRLLESARNSFKQSDFAEMAQSHWN